MKKQRKLPQTYEVTIDKLVHGGQGLGSSADGKKVFAWNALPGERVLVEARKNKKNYLEGTATQVLSPSADRIEVKDEAYLSTSPWQMMRFEAENRHKASILEETFSREHVEIGSPIAFTAGTKQLAYRNKMEYSFWGDDAGLHLALFHRASHGKRIVDGSSIAMPAVDETARKIRDIVQAADIRGSQLKTVIVRANQAGETVAALCVKDESFPVLHELRTVCRGVGVYYSNPKSPASVLTKTLYEFGDISLTDTLLGSAISYDVHSFFQVNLEVFEMALQRIQGMLKGAQSSIDMYAGVGAIGLSIQGCSALVESDPHNCDMARLNALKSGIEVIEATSESALEYITAHQALIVDPPRAGLHADLIDRILEVKPPQLVYLSCNPITQARDLARLQDNYDISHIEGFNFFPRTPHIECLVLLTRK